MTPESKQEIILNYRSRLLANGDSYLAVQWSTQEGQLFRFRKLAQIGDLTGQCVLDLGCGIGALYPFLLAQFGDVRYTGIDIVPESIAFAAAKYPDARFLCCDVEENQITEQFDYVLMSGLFNNREAASDDFLFALITKAFQHCRIGLGFNFISTVHNFHDSALAYHDPVKVMKYCLSELSSNVVMHHHYERCDVAVFVYR
jgi:SAM-dependent methyltransferase